MSPSNKTAKVAVVQMDCTTLDKAANLQKVETMLRESRATEKGVDLVCFPEGFATGFSLGNDFYNVAESIPGPTTEAMSALARRLNTYIVVPLVEVGPEPGLIYNSAVLLDRKGNEVGRYRKMHLPSFGVSGQKRFFQLGEGYPVFHTDFGIVGLTICYDRTFPEAMRAIRLQGAQVIVNINAIVTPAAFWWHPIFRARAIENQVYMIATNRSGPAEGKPGVNYYGHSLVVDYKGEIIAEAGQEDEVVLAELDILKLEEQRTAMPYIQDRRPDTYSLLVSS
jgi:predicted amidohydrolase